MAAGTCFIGHFLLSPTAYFFNRLFLHKERVSNGPLFPAAGKVGKRAARDQWSLDSLYSQEFRLLWAIKGIGAATDPLPLPAQAKKMMRLPPEHTDSPR